MTKFYGVTERAQYIFKNVYDALKWLKEIQPEEACICSKSIAEHHMNETYFGFRRYCIHNKRFGISNEAVLTALNEHGIDFSCFIKNRREYIFLELPYKDPVGTHETVNKIKSEFLSDNEKTYCQLKQRNEKFDISTYQHVYFLDPKGFNTTYFKLIDILPLIPLEGVAIANSYSLEFTIYYNNSTEKYITEAIHHYLNKYSN